MNIPNTLKYTKEHEWLKIDGDVVVIGITSFAVEQLGDITLVEMPEIGDDIESGETIGTVESVKTVSDVYSPVSGEVIGINDELEDAPEKVNEDCYEEGWMFKLKLEDLSELSGLMDADDYQKYLDTLEE